MRRFGGWMTLTTVVVVAFALTTPTSVDAESGEAPKGNVPAAVITTGGYHTCAVLDGGIVKCWGYGTFGQLGIGNTSALGDDTGEMDALPAVALGTRRTAIAVSAGALHTCALLDNRRVKCWGGSDAGALGQGPQTAIGDQPNEMGDNLPTIRLGTGRTARAVSTGDDFTCALLDNARVKCWGRNGDGQLGQGSTDSLGDQPGEMGDSLPTIRLGTGRTAIAVTAGDDHACALLDNHRVKCWGGNDFGQLGQGNIDAIGDEPNEMGDSLPAVDLGTGRTAKAVSAGGSHTCALLDDATVKCWGLGSKGQVGDEFGTNWGNEPNEMGDDLAIVPLGSGRTALAISSGAEHTCALLDDHTIKCWGAGANGRLGQGNPNDLGDAPNEIGDSLAPVPLRIGRKAIAVSAGGAHSCALLDDATLQCWGYGVYGQLGQDAPDDRGDGPSEMGNDLPSIDTGRLVGRSIVDLTLSADRSVVVAGDTITYRVRVRNTGSIPLTQVVVRTKDTSCGRTITVIAPQTTVSYRCRYKTRRSDVPGMSNQLFVGTTQGATDSSARVRTRVDSPSGQQR